MGNSVEEYNRIRHIIEAKKHEVDAVRGRGKQPVHIKKVLPKVMDQISEMREVSKQDSGAE